MTRYKGIALGIIVDVLEHRSLRTRLLYLVVQDTDLCADASDTFELGCH
jgi:hypothetical protein